MSFTMIKVKDGILIGKRREVQQWTIRVTMTHIWQMAGFEIYMLAAQLFGEPQFLAELCDIQDTIPVPISEYIMLFTSWKSMC